MFLRKASIFFVVCYIDGEIAEYLWLIGFVLNNLFYKKRVAYTKPKTIRGFNSFEDSHTDCETQLGL